MSRRSIWTDFSYSFSDNEFGEENAKRLSLLTFRRMHELGLDTYAQFADVSGINAAIVRQVLGGHKSVGSTLASRWLDALQLGVNDVETIRSWFNPYQYDHPSSDFDPFFKLSEGINDYELGEFHSNPVISKSLYAKATQKFRLIVRAISETTSPDLRIVKAEALYRLARLELDADYTDRAYWHAHEGANLARGIDGDLFLMCKKEAARACFQLGRTKMWNEGYSITKEIINLSHRRGMVLGQRFHEQHEGFWEAMIYRDAINMLVRRRNRTEARDMLAALRRAMRPTEEPIHEYLVKISEARLQIREGRSKHAMRLLIEMHSTEMPENCGPPHYMTLISTMADAQIMGEITDKHGRDFLIEALQWARASGLRHKENELLLLYRKQIQRIDEELLKGSENA